MTKPINKEEQVRSRRHWQAHFNAAAKSSLSRAEYCRRRNLSYHTMGYWHRKLSREKCHQTFVPQTLRKERTLTVFINQERPHEQTVVSEDWVTLEVPYHGSPARTAT